MPCEIPLVDSNSVRWEFTNGEYKAHAGCDSEYHVKDATATVVNEAFADLLADNPLEIGVFGGSGNNVTGPRFTKGGGTVIIEGDIDVNETIKIPPMSELNFCHAELCATAAVTMIEAADGGIFSRTAPRIIGFGTIDGKGIATAGIDFSKSNHGRIEHVVVHNVNGNGVVTEGSQWLKLDQVSSISNAGSGFHFDAFNDGTTRFGANDITMIACHAEENGINGVTALASNNLRMYGLTSQFHENGAGVHLANAVFAAKIDGAHFESNKYHAEVLQGCVGCQFDTCSWIMGDGTGVGSGVADYAVERFLVNEGIQTSIDGGGSFNDPAKRITAPTSSTNANGVSNALFEQNSLLGSLHVEDFATHRGGPAGRIPYATDEAGNLYPETDNPQNGVFSVSAIGNLANGATAPFPSGGFFGPDQPNE